MIMFTVLWLKIMYYKMIKSFKGSWSTWCRIHAEAGTAADGPRARHEDGKTPIGDSAVGVAIDPASRDGIVGFSREPGAPDDTIKTERLRRLIELGLVHEPDGLGDLTRVEEWREEWARREAGDPSACPCAGRHYPSAEACRWCRCHDPRNEHHTEGARGLMQVIKPPEPSGLFPELEMLRQEDVSAKLMDVRPSDEIVCCGACGHPQHTANGGRCAFLVPTAAGGALHFPVCGCVAGTDRLVCPRCDHAPHTGRCSSLVTGQDPEGPMIVCRCTESAS